MSTRSRVVAAILATSVALGLGTAAALEWGEQPPASGAVWQARPTAPDFSKWRPGSLGTSFLGRRIWDEEIGNPSSRRRILVVGCIHGDECAGIAIARDLVADRPPPQVALSVIPDLNPDGLAAGTRQNARGVDLNRNFPSRWRPIGTRGDLHYSGTRPLSEPESRLARRFILKRRPFVTIWFHQHMDLVDESGGKIAIERRYAHLTGARLRRLPRYPGSATGWENHVLTGSTAFVVELPPGQLTPRAVERFSDAVLRLLR